MRTLVSVALLLALAASHARADTFQPNEALVDRVAQRFRAALSQSGINGVGRDVLKCYDDNLDDKSRLKECVVYDVAALIVDRTMLQIFVARGVDAAPAALFTDRVFAARHDTYGKVAFQNDARGMKLVGPTARKVVEKVLPR